MEEIPELPAGYSQQPQQQQQQFPGQQPYYTAGVLPAGMQAVGIPSVGMPSMGTPGGMNMGTPGTLLPNGQFLPNGGVPAPGYSTGPLVFAPGPGVLGGGAVMADGTLAPAVGTQDQQPQQFVGVPPGMTRESVQPGYDPRFRDQKRFFNPERSFTDSFGNTRGMRCCAIS